MEIRVELASGPVRIEPHWQLSPKQFVSPLQDVEEVVSRVEVGAALAVRQAWQWRPNRPTAERTSCRTGKEIRRCFVQASTVDGNMYDDVCDHVVDASYVHSASYMHADAIVKQTCDVGGIDRPGVLPASLGDTNRSVLAARLCSPRILCPQGA